MIKPLNNHCLIEVINDYEGLVGTNNENVQKGVLRDYSIAKEHLTASTGYGIGLESCVGIDKSYKAKLGKTVYWQEYADSGSKFTIDGKDYVLVPFYRLIGVEDGK